MLECEIKFFFKALSLMQQQCNPQYQTVPATCHRKRLKHTCEGGAMIGIVLVLCTEKTEIKERSDAWSD